MLGIRIPTGILHAATRASAVVIALYIGSTVDLVQAQVAIRIGASVSMTGQFAELGQAQHRGQQLCVKQANARGGILGRKLEIVFEDDHSQAPDTVVVDLSADYRFDERWYYGLPELTRQKYAGQKRISNPGCYATAMQLAIAPLKDRLAGPPQCFGVSGYSGAGTTPSDKNNPELLRDNLMPYALADHLHEREVSRQLGLPVEFMPHVAPHFRGITMTVNLWLQTAMKIEDVRALYRERYAGEPLIQVLDEAPWVSRIAGRHGVEIGGFTLAPGGKRLVVVATLDNLLKGAATQAMQNLNLAFGHEELEGVPL